MHILYRNGLIKNNDFAALCYGLCEHELGAFYLENFYEAGARRKDIPAINNLLSTGSRAWYIERLLKSGKLRNENYAALIEHLTGNGIPIYLIDVLIEAGATKEDAPLLQDMVKAYADVFVLKEMYKKGLIREPGFVALFYSLREYGMSLDNIADWFKAGVRSEDAELVRRFTDEHAGTFSAYSAIQAYKTIKQSDERYLQFAELGFKGKDMISMQRLGITPDEQNYKTAEKFSSASLDSSLTVLLMVIGVEPTSENLEALAEISNAAKGMTAVEKVNLWMRGFIPGRIIGNSSKEENTGYVIDNTLLNSFGKIMILLGEENAGIKVPDSYSSLLIMPRYGTAGYRLTAADIPKDYINEMKERGISDADAVVGLYAAGISLEEIDFHIEHGAENANILDAVFRSAAFVPALDIRRAAQMPFSDRRGYEELYDDDDNDGIGEITIGVYCQFIEDVISNDKMIKDVIEQLAARAEKRRIVIKPLNSKDEFKAAMAGYDIVMFYGHANCGRGPDFGRGSEPNDYLRMGKDELLIPGKYLHNDDEVIRRLENGNVVIKGGSEGIDAMEVNADMFFYLGCRTDRYYRGVLQQKLPQLDFLGTNYASNAKAHLDLRSLILGLIKCRTLAEIIPDMEKVEGFNLLQGILVERQTYKNNLPLSGYPNRMFEH